ncbi:MAG TPA: heavy metal translocating P-type ATPase [Gemmatimonadales bacterium]|nr:heavy metal translocating P-type ATPase [Gemmatimonadales bacterium]
MSHRTLPSPADPTGARRAAPARCPHCGTAVEGAADVFCCHGCEVAAAIIRGAGLERYYQERRAFAPRPEPVDPGWDRVAVEPGPDGTVRARVQVDGLRCASCVWVTEQVLQRTPGVAEATVSYATGRTTLRWDPARTDLPALAARIAALGYRPRALDGETPADHVLMARTALAVFVAVALMGTYAALYAGWWFGAMDPRFAALFRWLSLLLATPVALWSAAPFFTGAWGGLRHRVLAMDLPIALGIAVLYVQGAVATLTAGDGYLDSLTMLVALLLVGRLLESRGRRRAAEAATALVASIPRTARRTEGDAVVTVPVEALSPGDRIDVGAGEEFAADGVVTAGAGQVRLALLTGEAEPVAVGPGDRVAAGTVLLDGALTVRVTAVGRDTVLHGMVVQLEAAADRALRPSAADRIAPWFTAATLVAAALTFAWWHGAGVGVALARTVAVLVVACPCALALAQPLAAAAGLGAAARRGLLLRSGQALLDLGRIDTVALDKTGTVTAGTMTVAAADDDVLRVAAGLERYSRHPVARAIVAEASARNIPLPAGTDVCERAGAGLTGIVDGRRWSLRSAGPGVIGLSDGQGTVGLIRLGDPTRGDAGATVAALRREGRRVVLLTGDHLAIARRVAAEAGISELDAGQTPSAKAAWVEREQRDGHRVLFAGDGLNDGPALAAADVGLAMGTGAASSVLVADGVISTASLAPLLAGFRAARAAERTIRLNLRFSIVYNVLAVGAAAAGLVNPLIAAILMPLSSGVVIWGASRVEHAVRKEEP